MEMAKSGMLSGTPNVRHFCKASKKIVPAIFQQNSGDNTFFRFLNQRINRSVSISLPCLRLMK